MNLAKGRLDQVFKFVEDIEDIKKYELKLRQENPDDVVEKLIEFDNSNKRVVVHFVFTKDGISEISEEDKLLFSFKNIFDISYGVRPAITEKFLIGDIQNPSIYGEFLSWHILDLFDYDKISKEIKDRYNLHDEYINGNIITYYSPEYNLIGFNVYRDLTLGILYYSLDKKDFIDFEEDIDWVKVMVEEVDD